MTPTIRQELAPALQAITFHSPTVFSFAGGAPMDVAQMGPPVQTPGQPVHPVPDHPMVRALQSILYWRCYSHSLSAPLPPPTESVQADPYHVSRLSAANHSVERWDPGWRVFSVTPDGNLLVTKGEWQRTAGPGEYGVELPIAPGAPVGPGTMVAVHMPRESRTIQQGFHFMFGETPGTTWDDHFTIRFYFNTSADLVPALVDHVSSSLNRYQVPYRMKALTTPSWYSRVDSMVLYVARRNFQIVNRLVAAMPPSTAAQLDDAAPLFSKRVRAGVGIAEDPGTSESFGMHRCRLVAEAVVDAQVKGQHSVGARLEAVAKRFTFNGLVLDRPHLNAGSADLPCEIH